MHDVHLSKSMDRAKAVHFGSELFGHARSYDHKFVVANTVIEPLVCFYLGQLLLYFRKASLKASANGLDLYSLFRFGDPSGHKRSVSAAEGETSTRESV